MQKSQRRVWIAGGRDFLALGLVLTRRTGGASEFLCMSSRMYTGLFRGLWRRSAQFLNVGRELVQNGQSHVFQNQNLEKELTCFPRTTLERPGT